MTVDKSNMTYNEALRYLKCGCKVGRKSWNDGRFIVYEPSCKIDFDEYPTASVKYHNLFENKSFDSILIDACFVECCDSPSTGNTIKLGWMPTFEDMMANDWVVKK